MKQIKLTQGLVALVDDEEFEALNQFKWYALKSRNTFYAVRNIRVDGKQKNFYMHWDVMGGKGVDHRDHNGCNNQRTNLRFATNSENAMNNRKHANTTSVFKGVTFHKTTGKWRADIKINSKTIYLGRFISEVDAAKAYNDKAIALFCEFANLNTF